MSLSNLLHTGWRRSWRLLLDLLIFVAFVVGVERWQSHHLLSADGTLKAPAFHLPTLGGESYDLTASNGRKRLLYFFAPFSSQCKLTGAEIAALRQQSGVSFDILPIAVVWEKRFEVENFVRLHGLEGPIVLGGETITKDYRLMDFPTFYFLDENGFIKGNANGYSSSLAQKIKQWSTDPGSDSTVK